MAMPLAIVGNNFSDVWNDRFRLLLLDKLANGVIKRDIYEVKKQFLKYDDDGTGNISLTEFLAFVDGLDMRLSKRVIKQPFRSIDTDGGGVVTFTEFAEFAFPDAVHELDHENTPDVPREVHCVQELDESLFSDLTHGQFQALPVRGYMVSAKAGLANVWRPPLSSSWMITQSITMAATMVS